MASNDRPSHVRNATKTQEPLSALEIGRQLAKADGKAWGDAVSAQELSEYGIPIFGGCAGCEASLAAYNAYPQIGSGYWACEACSEEPYHSIQEWKEDYGDQGITDSELKALKQFAESAGDTDTVEAVTLGLAREPGSDWRFARQWAAREATFTAAKVLSHYMSLGFWVEQRRHHSSFHTGIHHENTTYIGIGGTYFDSILDAHIQADAALKAAHLSRENGAEGEGGDHG